MQLPARPMPRPTAQVAPFFDFLGAELTVRFLLQFGGAELYLSADPKGRSAVEALIGPDRLKALATSDHRALQKRIPLASHGSPPCCTGRAIPPPTSPAPFARQT